MDGRQLGKGNIYRPKIESSKHVEWLKEQIEEYYTNHTLEESLAMLFRLKALVEQELK